MTGRSPSKTARECPRYPAGSFSRTVVLLHDRHGVGQERFERRVAGLMDDDEGINLPAARDRAPVQIGGVAFTTEGFGGVLLRGA